MHHAALAAGLHACHVEPFMVLGGGTCWWMLSVQNSACMLARVRSTGSMYHQRSMVLHRWQRACTLSVAFGGWVMAQGAAVRCDMTCTAAKAIAWQPGRAATQGSTTVASMHTPCQGDGCMFSCLWMQLAHLAP